MSDPVSSMDVEDVLSSIRRLVSEEAKAAEPSRESSRLGGRADIDDGAENDGAENAANHAVSQIDNKFPMDQDDVLAGEPPSNEMSSNEISPQQRLDEDAQVSFRHKSTNARGRVDKKLVLTAALRVAETENNAAQLLGEDAAQVTVPSADRPRRPARPHLRSVSDDGLTSDGSDVGADVESEELTSHRLGGVSRVNKLEFAPEDTLFERAKRAMESVKSTPVEPPAYVFASEFKPTPPRVAERPVAPNPVEEIHLAERTSDKDFDDAKTATAVDPDPTPKVSESIAETTTETAPEAITEAITETGSSASPFKPGGGALDPAHIDEENDLDDDIPSVNFVQEEESILDEETLRDLVSEMVREELQGELGDRITRNVRKLVRREIQRALASREFE